MLHEVSFKSYNQRDTVQGWIYVPAAKPKGIVQLVHGFGEHSRRYLHMIVAFMDAGYIVAANDPFDAFTKPTSTRSLYDFTQMMLCIEGTAWAAKVPTALPIYNIAGDEDPVGNYGTGVYEVSNWLIETGHRVKTKLYSGYRHEIHNYADIKCEVEAGIISFMDDIIA